MNKKNCQQDTNSNTCSFKNISHSVVPALKMLPSYSYSRYSNDIRWIQTKKNEIYAKKEP